jgi:hypothetical protein
MRQFLQYLIYPFNNDPGTSPAPQQFEICYPLQIRLAQGANPHPLQITLFRLAHINFAPEPLFPWIHRLIHRWLLIPGKGASCIVQDDVVP